jgi:hypothetical protein
MEVLPRHPVLAPESPVPVPGSLVPAPESPVLAPESPVPAPERRAAEIECPETGRRKVAVGVHNNPACYTHPFESLI